MRGTGLHAFQTDGAEKNLQRWWGTDLNVNGKAGHVGDDALKRRNVNLFAFGWTTHHHAQTPYSAIDSRAIDQSVGSNPTTGRFPHLCLNDHPSLRAYLAQI